jgi:hypothetical protein
MRFFMHQRILWAIFPQGQNRASSGRISVVDVTQAPGGQLGAAVRKGEKISVTGLKSEINRQALG